MSQTDEQQLLRAAQQGDEDAFRTLVARRRPELHAYCYRMLASFDDAEDAVQEALLRAWRGLPRFESRSSIRTWLYRITTNAALDVASGRARRELPVEFRGPASWGDPSGDPVTDISWMEPYPAGGGVGLPESSYMARETIELAYVAALQYLPANQRAGFILHEVLGFRSTEIAVLLGTTVAAVNSSLQRARVQLHDRLPKISQRTELRALGDAGVAELAYRYACAIEEGDLDALLSLLTVDASWSMPPLTSWFHGHDDVGEFLRNDVFPQRWRHVTTSANSQLAVAGYLFESGTGCFVPTALDVLTLKDGRIIAVTGFLTIGALTPQEQKRYRTASRLFGTFGLPEQLPAL